MWIIFKKSVKLYDFFLPIFRGPQASLHHRKNSGPWTCVIINVSILLFFLNPPLKLISFTAVLWNRDDLLQFRFQLRFRIQIIFSKGFQQKLYKILPFTKKLAFHFFWIFLFHFMLHPDLNLVPEPELHPEPQCILVQVPLRQKKLRFRFHNTVLQAPKCNTLLLLNTEHLVADSGLSSRSRPPSFQSEKKYQTINVVSIFRPNWCSKNVLINSFSPGHPSRFMADDGFEYRWPIWILNHRTKRQGWYRYRVWKNST